MAEATIAHVARTVTFPNIPAPLPAITRILLRYERQQLAGFIEVAIGLLDVLDGDPDLEVEDPAGETVAVIDDPEVPPEEDDGDPDLEETDCEDSFVLSNSALAYGRGPGCNIADPDKGVDDDGEAIDEAEPDNLLDFPAYGDDQSKGPLPPHLSDDRGLRRPHIERVRREKCRRLVRPDYMGRTHELVGA